MIGNFIGDFVRGRDLSARYGREIAAGIELHRNIDAFTDAHPVVLESKNRLRPKYRHYAGVIVDIFYDHFLARNWHAYHPELLPDFAERVYQLLNDHRYLLPEKVRFMLPYMEKGNWLVHYARVEGIARALRGMARRSSHNSLMEQAADDLVADYTSYAREFHTFFPQLRDYCRLQLREILPEAVL